MINTTFIKEGIYWIGVHDYTTYKFEGCWPIKNEGVNYNAYLINDEKVVLIDTVKEFMAEEYIENIKSIIGDKKVDYLIVNHMEPDHSSSMSAVVNEWPDVKIIGNQKTFPMIQNFYEIDKNFVCIDNGETLDLGGRVFQFFLTPMVHWPESMVTFDVQTGTLFSMDIFGSYKATVGSIFDDENIVESFLEPTYRYYATIVGKVTDMAKKSLNDLAPLVPKIKMICPSHGLVWRTDPSYILNLYIKLANAEVEEGVVIAYGTMYGNTRESAEIIADELRKCGVKKILFFDVGKTNISYILSAIWRYQGVFLGAPSYYGRILPTMANLLYKLEGNKLRNHVCGFFTDFSWSGGANREFDKFIKSTGCYCPGEMVNVKGYPNDDDVKALREMARAVAQRLK